MSEIIKPTPTDITDNGRIRLTRRQFLRGVGAAIGEEILTKGIGTRILRRLWSNFRQEGEFVPNLAEAAELSEWPTTAQAAHAVFGDPSHPEYAQYWTGNENQWVFEPPEDVRDRIRMTGRLPKGLTAAGQAWHPGHGGVSMFGNSDFRSHFEEIVQMLVRRPPCPVDAPLLMRDMQIDFLKNDPNHPLFVEARDGEYRFYQGQVEQTDELFVPEPTPTAVPTATDTPEPPAATATPKSYPEATPTAFPTRENSGDSTIRLPLIRG